MDFKINKPLKIKTMKNFGKVATDKVTGFTGVITGRCDYIYGCSQYLITPKATDIHKAADGVWMDIGRLEIGEQTISPQSVETKQGKITGGIRNDNPSIR
jgi:hypothetical protein